MEAVQVGAQGIGQDKGVAAIILGAGRRITIAKAVQLLGIDGKHCEALLHQRFHDGPARHLDSHRDSAGRSRSLAVQPLEQFGHTVSTVFDGALLPDGPLAIQEADLVLLGSPIDPDEELIDVRREFR